MKRSLLPFVLLLSALCALGTGCGRPYDVATPDGFVELTEGDKSYDEDAYEYRASTADGVVLAVRAWDNEPRVDLALATRALENRTRLGQGYALLEKKEVTSQNGVKGTTLRLGHDTEGQAHLFTVTVFVTEDHVYVVEAGGKKDLVEKATASIDWFLGNFRPK
jgi:hypothetical protein